MEPDEEVGAGSLSRSSLALMWDGGGCEDKGEGDLCQCVGGRGGNREKG